MDILGNPVTLTPSRPSAKRYGLTLIEDAAQAFGASIRAQVLFLRLYCHHLLLPGKPLGCYGDGSAIFTDDDAAADVIAPCASTARAPAASTITSVWAELPAGYHPGGCLLPKLKALKGYEIDRRREVAGRIMPP